MFGAGFGGNYFGPGFFPGGGVGGPFFNPYWGVSGFYGPVTTGVLDDSEIASYVKDNIDLDPYISVSDKNNIDVEVEGGTAILRGTVKNRRSKGLAYADAFWTAGVLDVENEIKVAGEEEGQTKAGQK